MNFFFLDIFANIQHVKTVIYGLTFHYINTNYQCLVTVKTVRKDEKRYYMDMLQYSQDHLMLYPYHLSDIVVKGLRVTPFVYYTNMMADIMSQEKSYDSLPNFTAADCKLIERSNRMNLMLNFSYQEHDNLTLCG